MGRRHRHLELGGQDCTDGAAYQRVKRGSELAVLRTFGDGALLARAGLILGPYENVGRLPGWLRRIARGRKVLAHVMLVPKLDPWAELRLWMPRDWDEPVDVSAAFAAGLTGRTAQETVTDTWAWLQAEGDPQPRRQPGLPPEKEQAVLAQFRSILLRAILLRAILLRADPVTVGGPGGQPDARMAPLADHPHRLSPLA